MLLAITLPSAVLADGVREGWGFQFRQDTFDKTLFPVAIMSEEIKDFDKASLLVACAKGGALIAAFSPSRIISFDQSAKVEFRIPGGTKEFTFTAVDIPHMGKFLGLSETDSAALLDAFSEVDDEVPYRSKTKQGTFTSIGAAKTFKIVKEHCPS